MPDSIAVHIGSSSDAGAWLGLFGAIFGAVLGAAASGGISYVLQKREFERHEAAQKAEADRQERVRQNELLQRQRSIGHRLIVKLMEIHSDLVKLEQHLVEEFSKQPQMPDAEPWQYVMPLFVAADEIRFDGEETALYLDLGLNDAFNVTGALPRVHSHLFGLMRAYGAKREQLRTMLPEECFREDHMAWTDAQKNFTAPLRTEMNDMITWAYGSIEQDATEARQALGATLAGLSEKLGIKVELDLSRADEIRAGNDKG